MLCFVISSVVLFSFFFKLYVFESTDTCAKEQVLSLLYKQHRDRGREREMGVGGGGRERERESGITTLISI